MTYRSILWTFLCIITFNCIQAQNDSCRYTLSGIVKDGETGESLPGALLTLENLHKNAVTDVKGSFRFVNLCSDTVNLICRYLGYKTVHQKVRIPDENWREIILHSDSCQMESIILTASKERDGDVYATEQLSSAEIDQRAGASLGEMLKDVKGVSALQTGPTVFKPVIQGQYGNRIILLNNDIKQEGQQWGLEHAPEIDPLSAGNISVIKGTGGLEYGTEAVGGVIQVLPDAISSEPGFTGKLLFGGFSNGRQALMAGRLDYRFKKISGLAVRVQGSLNRAGNYKTPDYFISNTGIFEKNFSVLSQYRDEKNKAEVYYAQYNSQFGIYKGSHVENLTDLVTAIQSDTPLVKSGFTYLIDRPYQKVNHELFKAEVKRKINQIGELRLQLGRQYNSRSEFDLHFQDGSEKMPQVQLELTTWSIKSNYLHSISSKLFNTAGLAFVTQKNTCSGFFFLPNYLQNTYALMDKLEYLGKDWTVVGGVRMEYKTLQSFYWSDTILLKPLRKFILPLATVGGNYFLSDKISLRSNITTGARSPLPNELYSNGVHHGAAAYESGNANLVPEKYFNLNAELNYSYGNKTFTVTGYNNFFKDYIYLVPVGEPVLTVRGAFPSFSYNQVKATVSGMELFLSDTIIKNLYLVHQSFFTRGFNQTQKQSLYYIPPARFLQSLTKEFDKGFLSKSFLKISADIILKKFDAPPDYTSAPAGYTIWSISSGKSIHGKSVDCRFDLQVNNIFNKRYRNYLDRFRYFIDAPGRNIQLRLSINFK